MSTVTSKFVSRAIVSGLALFVTACATPTNSVVQGGSESAIYFEMFPSEASVSIDGQAVGSVGDYDGVERTLVVPVGTHKVEISENGQLIYNKKVYVGREGAIKISR